MDGAKRESPEAGNEVRGELRVNDELCCRAIDIVIVVLVVVE